MRILYIAHEYKHRRIRYGKELARLGHKVDIVRVHSKRSGKVTSKHLKDHDLILVFSPQYFENNVIRKDLIDKAKRNGIPIASYSILATGFPFEHWARNFRYIQYPFVTNKPVTKMLNDKGIPAEYRSFGYYADLYKPLGLKPKYMVTFMGKMQGEVPAAKDLRAKALNKLIRHKIPVKIWGENPDGRVKGKVKKYHPDIAHKLQNQVYNQTKVNLDLPWINTMLPEYRNILHIKNRFMEIPGSGGFLLTKRCDEFEDIFKDGVHCGYYDDYGDMIDKIKYYAEHDSIRERIAKAGHNRVKESFQFKHILGSIVDEVQEKAGL